MTTLRRTTRASFGAGAGADVVGSDVDECDGAPQPANSASKMQMNENRMARAHHARSLTLAPDGS
jgi:hypothetical protein